MQNKLESSKITSKEYLENLLQDKSSAEYVITSKHTSKISGITHTYIRQAINGIEVYGTESSLHQDDIGTTVMANVNFIQNISSTLKIASASITAEQAIASVAQQMGYNLSNLQRIENATGSNQRGVFNSAGISSRDIPMKLMYYYREGEGTTMVWELSVLEKNSPDWWNFRVDASNGVIIDKDNWTVECGLAETDCEASDFCKIDSENKRNADQISTHSEVESSILPVGSYNVYPYPIESPNHGIRTVVSNPDNALASPFGWHDTDGVAGPEFTTTRGNNVLAQEDVDGNNGTGNEAEGGATLNFNFPVDLNQQPITYQNAAITNLFYWNNFIHDVYYQYGFDEISGNFQQNNYGNGGDGNDYVLADAQDGSGRNNANFGTPPDGLNPRMQMFLWDEPIPVTIDVTTPALLMGTYNGIQAAFGSPFSTTPLVGDFALYDDNIGDNQDACQIAVNAAALSGKIVVIRRGSCSFESKVLNAENAGALAVIVVNNVQGSPRVMGGSGPGVTIPSMMISHADGEPIIASLAAATTVSGSATGPGLTGIDIDGDFDNLVIAHEYAHGISNRLTGGRSNTGCLQNAEQMGEGWSDYFGLMLTINPGDTRTDRRGIATFLRGSDPLDTGIRNAPYSTDFAINDYTYEDSNNTTEVSQPHGVGFVWCTMLWEMTWDLIDLYGFDPDVYNGTGGNNKAIELVMEGLKLQPCYPGFVDGRDAILAADIAINEGVNYCLIWEAFARRGLGASASQGSSFSRTDGIEAFDLPPGLGSPTLETVNTLCVSSGEQILGGGLPSGGEYSGSGVTDDGNGVSYTFDPNVNGAGSVVVTYKRANLCDGAPEMATDIINIDDDMFILLCQNDINSCEPVVNFQFPETLNNSCFPGTDNRISQNNDETRSRAVDCVDQLSGHLRRFNLTTEGVLKDYLVTGIDVGINTSTGADIIVNLYLDNTIDNPITTYIVPISNIVTPYASVVSSVPSGFSFIHTVPLNLFLPTGTAFTVEVISPVSQDFMIAYNSSGVYNVPNSTATAYTSCSGSMLPYQDLTAFDLGENAALIQVQGTESNSLTTIQTAGITSGEIFPLGTTTNTFETTNGIDTVSCSFDVNISWQATCPQVTDLGDFFCTNLDDIPAHPTTVEQAAAAPYNIPIGNILCGEMSVSSVDDITTYDICVTTSGRQTITRTVSLFEDINRNGDLDEGEESQDCSFTFEIVKELPIPTLGQWGIIILSFIISIFGITALRERKEKRAIS